MITVAVDFRFHFASSCEVHTWVRFKHILAHFHPYSLIRSASTFMTPPLQALFSYSSFSSSSPLLSSFPFPSCHHLSFLFLSSPFTSPSPFPCSHCILIQHQRAPVAPAGWPLASHFLSCSPAIQQWRAPSGLSGPQGVHQKPPLG